MGLTGSPELQGAWEGASPGRSGSPSPRCAPLQGGRPSVWEEGCGASHDQLCGRHGSGEPPPWAGCAAHDSPGMSRPGAQRPLLPPGQRDDWGSLGERALWARLLGVLARTGWGLPQEAARPHPVTPLPAHPTACPGQGFQPQQARRGPCEGSKPVSGCRCQGAGLGASQAHGLVWER